MTDLPSPRAVIFANGEIENLPAMRAVLRPTDTLVAADGGTRHLAALGLLPAILLGDLDSLANGQEAVLRAAGVAIHRFPVEKDATDLELALDWVIERGFGVIRIAGALGGRLDHTLGNLALLASPRLVGIDMRLDDGITEVLLVEQEVEILGAQGDLLSLLPLDGPARAIWTEGLYYPLKGETLHTHQTRGISNVFLGAAARVRLAEGKLMAIHIRHNYPAHTPPAGTAEEER